MDAVNYLLLAATSAPLPDGRTAFMQMLPWLIGLLVIVILGGAALVIVRNRLKASETASPDTGFTLADLRALRDRGEISEQEYHVARNKIVTSVKKSLQPKPVESPPPLADLSDED